MASCLGLHDALGLLPRKIPGGNRNQNRGVGVQFPGRHSLRRHFVPNATEEADPFSDFADVEPERSTARSRLADLDAKRLEKLKKRKKKKKQKRKREQNEDPPPKAWKDKTLLEKGLELMNKASYGLIIAVVVGWVLWRLVGPALGLYKLESSLFDK